MSAAAPSPVRSLSRPAIAAALLFLAFAVAVGIFASSRPAGPGSETAASRVVHAIGQKLGQALNGVDTVAAMLAERSPGERAAGALASLKHKRVAALHERALPKIRSAPPVSPLASIVGAPPVPPAIVPPVAGPLFNTVSKAPGVLTPVAQAGPIVFPAMSPPPGGGLVIPPVITQVTPPVTPALPLAPAVPEPASWLMMLVGFGFLGWVIRRDGRSARSA